VEQEKDGDDAWEQHLPSILQLPFSKFFLTVNPACLGGLTDWLTEAEVCVCG
jgi:hypothetical protein